jgi:conjugative relaxase-like TrwC/TraI family protein
MISTPTWITSTSAEQYHLQNKDNYYQKEGDLGTWQGKGAEELGLNGKSINPEIFKNLLEGKDPAGNQIINIKTDKNTGERIRAALDLTFSAPKSVSVLYEAALANGNTELANQIKEAHEQAVSTILEEIEEKYAAARVTKDGETKLEHTNNLVIAKFTHEIARPVKEEDKVIVDPSLHTHALILNMTKIGDEWKAIESKEIFQNYIKMGQLYRNELASKLQELGFNIEITDANKGFFEIKGINKDILEEFSKRSEQIDELVEELKKQYPNKSENELRQMAAWKSREWKGEIDRKALLEMNKERLEKVGLTQDKIKELQNNKTQTLNKEETVKQAIKNALEAVTSEQSIFKEEDILEKAAKFSLKEAISFQDLKKTFRDFLQEKQIISLIKNYFTTKEIIQAEKEIVDSLKNKNFVENIFTKKEALEKLKKYSKLQKEATGFELTKGQKEAAALILSSKDLVIGIQGDAGTGKTTMLKAVSQLSENKVKIIGLSYTGKAASEIQKATASQKTLENAGIESQTIASFLSQVDKFTKEDLRQFKNSKLIIDEASMLGTKDMKKLINFAKKAKAQIVLLGDVKQFKAIQAGDPFSLLQEAGMKTAKMSEVLRQKNEMLKKAVNYLNKFNAEKAFEVLNNKIIETNDPIKNITEEFLNKNDLKNTNNLISLKDLDDKLIITNTNKLKNELNETIRQKLKEKNLIDKKDFTFKIRENARITPSQAFLSENYEVGQKIFIQKEIKELDLKAGEEFEILKKDDDKNAIFVKKGKELKEINLKNYGLNLQVYNELEKNFSIGEKIVFEKNDKMLGISNGETGIIKNIDENGNIIIDKDGKEIKFNISQYNYLNHGYALTTYKSQGQTSKNVIAYLDAKAQNFNSFYVTVTRAQNDLKIFTDDKELLKEMVGLEQEKFNALNAFEKLKNQDKFLNTKIYYQLKNIEKQYNVKLDKSLFKNEEKALNFIKQYENKPTPKQLKLAESLTNKYNLELTKDILNSKKELNNFIQEYIDKPTENQINLAKNLAKQLYIELNKDILNSKKELSNFISNTLNTLNLKFENEYEFKEALNNFFEKIEEKGIEDFATHISKSVDEALLEKEYFQLLNSAAEFKNIEALNKLLDKNTFFNDEMLQDKVNLYAKALEIDKNQILDKIYEKYAILNNLDEQEITNFKNLKDFEKEFVLENLIEKQYEFLTKEESFELEKIDAKIELVAEKLIKKGFDFEKVLDFQIEAQVKLTQDFLELDEKRKIEFLIENNYLDKAFNTIQNSNFLDDFEKEIYTEKIFEKFENPKLLDEIAKEIEEKMEMEEKITAIDEEEKLFENLEHQISKIESEKEELNDEKIAEIEEKLEKIEENEKTKEQEIENER